MGLYGVYECLWGFKGVIWGHFGGLAFIGLYGCDLGVLCIV